MENTLLNLIPSSYIPEVHLSQYDIGRELKFKLMDGNTEYSVPSGASVTVKATKPSGLGFVVSGTFSGNIVTIVNTETMTNESGRFSAELSISSGATLLGTSNFIFNIERSPHPEGTTDGDAETLIPELTLLVNEIRESNAKVESMTASATSLPEGSEPTAEYDPDNNNLAFGIPAGVSQAEFNALKSGLNNSVLAPMIRPELRNGSVPNAGNVNAIAQKYILRCPKEKWILIEFTGEGDNTDVYSFGISAFSGATDGMTSTEAVLQTTRYVIYDTPYENKTKWVVDCDLIRTKGDHYALELFRKTSGGVYSPLRADTDQFSVNIQPLIANPNLEITPSLLGITKTASKADLSIYRTGTGSAIESLGGTRIRNIYHVKGSLVFTAKCPYGSGLDIALYSTLDKALIASSDYISVYDGGWTTSIIKGIATEGYLSISQKKTDSSAISDAEMASFYSSLEFEGTETFEDATRLEAIEQEINKININGVTKAWAIKKNFEGNTYTANGNTKYLPSFVHLTDIHGDMDRTSTALKIAKALGVDAVLNSGDTVYYYSTDKLPYSFPTNVLLLPTIGNHDAKNSTLDIMSKRQIQPADDGTFVYDSVLYPTYYYKDFAEKKIRIIVLNQFETGAGTSVHYSQAQINFLISSLASTPKDYGVLLMYHKPEYIPSIPQGYEKFSQPVVAYQDISIMKPITKIVDAFIAGEILSTSYSNDDGSGSITISADFTGKNSGVEFIAHINGHEHYDRVGYLPTTQKQLNLNAVCTNAWTNMNINGAPGTSYPEYNEGNDLAREIGTDTEDAFNVYVIDRARKMVRIARIGSSVPALASVERDFMAIPYAE